MGILVEGCALVAASFGAFVLLSFLVDRGLRLEVGYRIALLAVFAIALARLVQTRLVRPLGADLSDDEVALAVERADPKMKQALISAVQFEAALGSQGHVAESRSLMGAVVRDVGQSVAEIEARQVLDGRRVARFAGLLVAAVLALGAWAALAPETARLWASRNIALSSLEWPRFTTLAFDVDGAGPVRVAEGGDLTLRLQASGVIPEQVQLHYEFEGGDRGMQPMTTSGDGAFSFTLRSVLEGAVVHAVGGDGATERLAIEVLERPRIESVEVALLYPPYMEKEPESVAVAGSDVLVPEGGSLVVGVRFTKRIINARLTLADAQDAPMEIGEDGRTGLATLRPAASGLLSMSAIDQDRLAVTKPPQFFVRVVEDMAPSVEFRPTGVGSVLTPVARVPGTLAVREDHGLAGLWSQFRITGGANQELGVGAEPAQLPPWQAAEVSGLNSFAAGASSFEGQVVFDLKSLHPGGEPTDESGAITPGQFVSLRFSAKDNFGPGAAHVGESDPVVFRIVTRQKLVDDLSRRQSEQRRELQLIVDRERAMLAELREIVSPAADDPRAAAARLRVLEISRTQRALGQRTRSVADNYRQILDEYANNRALEPGDIGQLRGQIQEPLQRLATDDFLASATATQEFGQDGGEDLRAATARSYEAIIERLMRVLAQMEEAETFAALLEGLRQTIKLQNSAIREAEARRSEETRGLFGPPKRQTGDKKRDDR